MRNKFLETGEHGYHPFRKIAVVFSGLHHTFRYDFSVTYKLILSVIVLGFFFIFRQWVDFLLLAAATIMMIQAELFNSAIEAICDFLTQEKNRKIKVIKDIAAAAAGVCIFLWWVILAVETYRVITLFVLK